MILLACSIAPYVWYSEKEFPHGGSAAGLIYGVIGVCLILLLTAFGLRKRAYRSRLGTLEQWLQSHIYLGVLVLVIVTLHTGGRFEDRIAVAAFVVLTVVVISGIAGSILYATVPRLLTEVETNLTPEEVSDQLNQMSKQMARIASGRSVQFQRLFEKLVNRGAPGFLAGWRLLLSRRKHRGTADSAWTSMLPLVPREEQDQLRQMLVVSRQREELLRRLIQQQRYKNFLDVWLYLHIPFTAVLLLLTVVHIAAVFYFGKLK